MALDNDGTALGRPILFLFLLSTLSCWCTADRETVSQRRESNLMNTIGAIRTHTPVTDLGEMLM